MKKIILTATVVLGMGVALPCSAQTDFPALPDSISPTDMQRMPPPPGMDGDSLHRRPPMRPEEGDSLRRRPRGMRPGGPMGGPGGGMGMPPGGGMGHQAPTFSTSKTGLAAEGNTAVAEKKTYTSGNADENAVAAGKDGTISLVNCTVQKLGADSDNGDGTSFYGTNAAILAHDGGTINISGGSIETQAVGANGIVAYGGTVNVADMAIECKSNLSRGIHATGGGTINASNLNVRTHGNNSSVIATDRGGGTVSVSGGKYECSGGDAAVCYSTGTINVQGIEGYSHKGEVGVIEGDNVINIENCKMTSGDNRRGLMILQSGSGDALGNNGQINITGGSVTLLSNEAPLIEITTSTKGTLTLKDVELTVPSGELMRVDYNTRWNTTSPIAILNLDTEKGWTYNGDVTVDQYGTSTVNVRQNVVWNGAYDTAKTGKMTTVTVSGTWNLTADSNVQNVNVLEGGVINYNGHKLTYDNLTNKGTINK